MDYVVHVESVVRLFVVLERDPNAKPPQDCIHLGDDRIGVVIILYPDLFHANVLLIASSMPTVSRNHRSCWAIAVFGA